MQLILLFVFHVVNSTEEKQIGIGQVKISSRYKISITGNTLVAAVAEKYLHTSKQKLLAKKIYRKVLNY